MWLGVTLAIPEPYRSVLARARAEAGDPLAGIVPPHVTLVPPTRIEPGRLAEVCEMIDAVARSNPEFTIALHSTETFRPVSPVVFVALQRGWEECTALQEQLNDGALAQAREFPYYPHVTIAHNLTGERLDHAQESMRDFAGRFTVCSIELFEHVGEQWREVRSFPLVGAGGMDATMEDTGVHSWRN